MKISKEDKEEIFRRKEILEVARVGLKKEFIGLDDIINELIDLIESWYLFPSGQIRPTIINLFGMTGVGKTSLIKRLFELIDLKDNLYKFDIGEYNSQENSKLSYAFSDNLRGRENNQIGIIFDEFQLGRTIDEGGVEIEKSGLRAMWELLDTGKISILQSSFCGSKIYQLSLKLEDCVNNGSVEAKNGLVTKNKEYHQKFFKEELVDEEFALKDAKNKKNNDDEILFIPEEFNWYINEIWENRFLTDRELTEFLKSLNHQTSVEFLNQTVNKALKPVEFNYASSCIFVIGNIDEAYRMSKNIDPDGDADRFYEHSKKITLPQIKSALQRRFRAEQIARLGNNHIIYPAFSSKMYRDLINLELKRCSSKVKEKFDIDIIFKKTVGEIIYKEGVFPTQGARPLFTTINYLIESFIGKIIRDIFELEDSIKSIIWKFYKNKYIVSFLNKENKLVKKISYPVRLKVENLRKSEESELQAQVAIHESGHAVAAIYAANILPIEVVSRSANMSEGHCAVEIPSTGLQTRDELEKEIIICLGGYVAEKLVFGQNKVANGTSGDFYRATNIALEMAKSYGMLGAGPMLYGHKSPSTNSEWSSYSVDEMDKLAEKIIIDSEIKCKKILSDNKLLLLKLGEHLSNNSRMDSSEIQEFVNNYGSPVEIKSKDDYHMFKSTIAKELAEEELSFRPKKNSVSRVEVKLKQDKI